MRSLCRPRVGIMVRGELVSVDAEAGVFTVLVDKANRHGKRFVSEEATFKLAKKGKLRKHGRVTLADVEAALEAKSGYRVKVISRACRSEIRDKHKTPDLYAKHVKVNAEAKHDEKEEHDEKSDKQVDGSDEEPKGEEGGDAA